MSIAHIPLVPSDVRVLINLRQGDQLRKTAKYEWAALTQIPPIERLLRTLSQGAGLPLHWQDEFRVGRDSHTYFISKKGRLNQLFSSLVALDEVCQAIHIGHLSPWVQALHQAFLYSSSLSHSYNPYHDVISPAFLEAMRLGKPLPHTTFDYRFWKIQFDMGFSEEHARALIKEINPHYLSLVTVIKQTEVKRAQKNRSQQAIKHHLRKRCINPAAAAWQPPAG